MVSVSNNKYLETAPAAILFARQYEERPADDFLLTQQGFFSGKSEGDLDSVPGFYGGTASYKFVQNIKALQQHRVVRYRQAKREHDRVVGIRPTLMPSEARIEAYNKARGADEAKPVLKGTPRGPVFKRADEFGAFKVPNPFRLYKKDSMGRYQGGFVKDAQGNYQWKPSDITRPGSLRNPAAAAVIPQINPQPVQRNFEVTP
jgi:hypothetical protein